MSEEDRAPDEPAPAPADARAARANLRKLRIPILGGVAIALVAASLLLARRGPAIPDTPGSGATPRAAINAPPIPQLGGEVGVRISGTVLDGAGVPVAAAEVSAELERGVFDPALSGAPPGASPDPRAGSASNGAAFGSATSLAGSAVASPTAAGSAGTAGSAAPAKIHVSTPTNPDGKFVIAGLEPGRYRLRVAGTGLFAAEVRYVPVPSDEVRIVVARQVRIAGKVIDGNSAVPNAHVGLRGEAIGGTIETRTDSHGAFHFTDLPEGRYQLYAWQGALAARAVRVNRLGAGPFEPIELRLESGAIVVGRVIDRDDGTGLIAAVELRPVGDDQAPRYARSGDDGVFRIEGLPHGEWIADAFAPGYTSPGGVPLEAGRGIPELALVPGGTIEGRVLDGAGNPIGGATVRALGAGPHAPEYSAAVDQDRLRRFSGRMSAPVPAAPSAARDADFIPRGELGVTVGPIPPIPPPGAQIATRPASIDPSTILVPEPPPLELAARHAPPIWTTGRDGAYRIRGVPRGKVVVLAVAPGLAEGRSRPVAIDPGKIVSGIDVTLTPGTIVAGKVTNQHGTPVVGAQVSAQPALGAPVLAFTDIDGLYKLGPLTGTIELSASAYGHADAREKVELPAATGSSPAEHRVDLRLAVADAILAGTIDDATGAAVAGATIEVLGADRRAVAGDDGTFAIDMLAEGTHRIRITHPDYPPFELAAVASAGGFKRARVRVPLGGAVDGVLLDGASGAPLAGFAVTAEGPGNATADATTDKGGLFKLGPLAPGRWKIAVKQPGYVPLARDVDVAASRAPGVTSVRDLRLDLQRGALVGGTVRDARGSRAANATVTVQRADGTGPIASGTTDVQGEFRIHDCPTGEVAVVATKGDASGSTRATIRAGDEILSLAIELR